jgi:hypothetical protein
MGAPEYSVPVNAGVLEIDTCCATSGHDDLQLEAG